MEEPKSKAKRGAKTAAAAQEDKITLLPLSELHDFPNHPFKVRDDEAMQETTESIRQYGVLVPAIVRPREDGGYEIIAGHRRRHGSELAGLSAMPCIVREMDDDTATILMVDSNIQRENILPSERAQAYKMKLEAIRRKAGRPAKAEEIDTSENGGQNGHDLRGIKSRELLAENSDDSARTIQRYIRLTELTPELQQMVDEKKIGMTPAVEISYLKPEEQQMLLTAIDSEQASSYVVTDPKGSIVVECGKLLQRNQYKIKILNTINFKKSHHYNPFAYLHGEKDILKLVTTLIANTQGDGKSGDDFWRKAETLLYTALIGYIYYEAPAEEQNFATLIEMINTMEVREDDEDFKNPVDLMFEELAKREPHHFAVRQYAKYRLAAGVVCSKRLLNQMIWKSLRTHNFTYRRKETKP